MFLKSLRNLKKTLAFRLTIWYAAVLSISMLLALSIFYCRIVSIAMESIDEELTNEIEEFSLIMTEDRVDHVKMYMKVEVDSEKDEHVATVFRLISGNGQVLVTETTDDSLNIGSPPETIQKDLIKNGKPLLQTISIPGNPNRFRTIYGLIAPSLILQVTESLEEIDQYLSLFQKVVVLLTLPFIFLSGVIGWLLAKHAMKGVEEVTRTAHDITCGAHEMRVEAKPRSYEIERLASTFNAMLDRIQALMKSMREMTDNFAHDLRSPLTRIRGIAEMTLIKGKNMDEYQKMAASTVEECDNLIALVNTMLDITEVESGTGDFKTEQIDLVKIIRSVFELYQPLADEKGIRMVIHLPETLMLKGVRQNIQRLVANLLENAIKYTPSGGTIKISSFIVDNTIRMIIEDTGFGIPESELPKIFDRFYRSDRSRTEPGIGLGLSLAKAIANAHGGDITAKSVINQGSSFIVTLPAGVKKSDTICQEIKD